MAHGLTVNVTTAVIRVISNAVLISSTQRQCKLSGSSALLKTLVLYT